MAASKKKPSREACCLIAYLSLLTAVLGGYLLLKWLVTAVNNDLYPPVPYAVSCLKSPNPGSTGVQTGVLDEAVPTTVSSASDDPGDESESAPDSDLFYTGVTLEAVQCGITQVPGPVSRAACEKALADSHAQDLAPEVGSWYCTTAFDGQPVELKVISMNTVRISLAYTEWQ